MRPKRLAVDGNAERLARRFDVVMEQLQLRFRCHTNPYDAGPAKVRKRADAADLRADGAISFADATQRVRERGGEVVGLFSEEFHRQVQLRLSHPGEVW